MSLSRDFLSPQNTSPSPSPSPSQASLHDPRKLCLKPPFMRARLVGKLNIAEQNMPVLS